MTKKFLALAFFLSLLSIEAQNFTRQNEWKRYQKTVYGGIGASNFLGELGGLNKIGTHYSPADLEFTQTRTAFTLGYRYKIAKVINLNANFNHLLLKGDDALTKEPFRNNRNLNFRSNVFELSGRVEFMIMNLKAGNRYGIRRTLSRRMKNQSWDFGAFVGIGGFYFNPVGRDASGNKHKLKKLHTEGQGLPGGPAQYSNFSACIPFGLCFNSYFNRTIAVGVELNFRKTFTDYIDDVSTVYYDKTALLDAYGPTSVQMSDPNKGTIPGATAPDAAGNWAQRGNPKHKDAYMSLQITVGYIIKPKRSRSRLRSKF